MGEVVGGEYVLGVTGGAVGVVTLPLTLVALGTLLPVGGSEGDDLVMEVDIRRVVTIVLGVSIFEYC